MEIMREKHKVLEARMADLIGLAQENAAISHKVHGWTQSLLRVHKHAALPRAVIDGLQTTFKVPHVTLRLWQVAPEYQNDWFARCVSDDAKLFANSLLAPYCGNNHDFEAVRWLAALDPVQSAAILPLRAPGKDAAAFGLLIMGSPDPERFTADMATDFLIDIGTTASAALGALQA